MSTLEPNRGSLMERFDQTGFAVPLGTSSRTLNLWSPMTYVTFRSTFALMCCVALTAACDEGGKSSTSVAGSGGRDDVASGAPGSVTSGGSLTNSSSVGGKSSSSGASSGGNPSTKTSSSAGGSPTSATGAGGSGDSADPAAICGDPSLVWKSARKTNYISYPDPGSEECIVYNGCQWAGQFAACDGQKSEQWVASHNIAAAFPDFQTLELHDLCLRKGSKLIVVTVLDTCGDSDCDGCCTKNQGSADQLIDLESFTNERWGVSDGLIEWADLGPTKTQGCD